MSPQATIRDWARLIFYLSQNTLSLIGVVLTTSSAITLIGFWTYDFMLPGPPHPYVGILLFLILPGLFLLGLALIPVGILLRRRKLRAAGELPSLYPAIDLGTPMLRNGLLFIGVATVLNVLIFGFASYRGVTYYQNSPHARVECVQCHIGPGAGWFVRSKLSGLRQVFAVTFKTYSRPIPSPVKYLRPARETCDQCHWPQRFSGDKFLLKTNYKEDEKNTPLTTALILKIGGHTLQGAVGIHGRHLDEGSRIHYVSIDDRRQVIPIVYYTDDQGKQRKSNWKKAKSGRWTASTATTGPLTRLNCRKMRSICACPHPNNLGHSDFPGCFRCHDGSHSSADGQTISNDCIACHNLLAVQEENPKVLKDLGLQ